MKPIVVYHPEINGKGVSACDPDILEKQQVGMVMNTKWTGKLRAEAWIDEKQAGAVDGRVLEALENNSMMEVSTGLFTDNVGEAGEWNGEAYNAEATNHQPDHLALLPDKIGACSIADGAGLLQLNEVAEAGGVDVTRLLAREMDVLRRMVGNAMSHSNIYSALARALRTKLKTDDVWVVDVYDNFFIYDPEQDKKLYRLNYTASDAGVEITGDPEEVLRVTEYRTAQGEFVGNAARKTQVKEIGMNKQKLVDNLIANAGTQWGEDDREALMGMDEATLAKMHPVDNAQDGDSGNDDGEPKGEADGEADGAQNGAQNGDEPVTMEAYVANAPAELRDVLTNAVDVHNATKAKVIEEILANQNNRFTKEFLGTKGLQELQGMAALIGNAKADDTPAGEVPMFYGGAATPAGAPVANEGEVTEEPLLAPTMNFGKEEAKATA
jgi:hypothetical protein